MNLIEKKLNNGKCMASLKKTPNKACGRKIKDGYDFCGYHYKTKKYNLRLLKIVREKDIKDLKLNKLTLTNELKKISTKLNLRKKTNDIGHLINNKYKYLDESYDHMLMGIKDSWAEVPFENVIKLNDDWWDLNVLCEIITNKINQSNMENPYPIYPSSPFTRKLLLPSDFVKIRERLQKTKIYVNIGLKIFLDSNLLLLSEFYNEASSNKDYFSAKLLSHLSIKLRYGMSNNQNSQSQFTGYWIRKNIKKNSFEKKYEIFRKMPPQIYNAHISQYSQNYDRVLLNTLMISDLTGNWNHSHDFTKEQI
jgi:hypothetical protein